MFEKVFKNIDDVLRKESGCGSELDYVEQTSWIIFLKYLKDLDIKNSKYKELLGEEHQNIFSDDFSWETWACPKNSKGEIDYQKCLVGNDLITFVNNELFPYLEGFKSVEDSSSIEYKIGVIFSEIKNRFQDGYNLREVLDLVDELSFNTSEEVHEMSHLYEARIQRMGNAGRNGGEYYTPRPLIKSIVNVMDLKVGDTIYDGACGSAGFLCEAFNYLREGPNSSMLRAGDLEILQKKTLYGQEKKSLAYIIGIMNLILHGVESPNITRGNTLSENSRDYEEKDRHDVVLANPPFGGKERAEVQQNFEIKVSETAYLFVQHFYRKLKANGRAAIVIKNTCLSNGDAKALRKLLLEKTNLHSILDLPGGTFTGAGVKTVVLFFDKINTGTKKIWYYQLNLDRNLGKTNPLNSRDMEEFERLFKTKGDSDNSWSVDVSNIDVENYDLSVKNPNEKEEEPLRSPEDILEHISILDLESSSLLEEVKKLI